MVDVLQILPELRCEDGYMIITKHGTTLSYIRNKNEIIIMLPQTAETATTTALPIVSRRVDVSEADLSFLTSMIDVIFGMEKLNEQT